MRRHSLIVVVVVVARGRGTTPARAKQPGRHPSPPRQSWRLAPEAGRAENDTSRACGAGPAEAPEPPLVSRALLVVLPRPLPLLSWHCIAAGLASIFCLLPSHRPSSALARHCQAGALRLAVPERAGQSRRCAAHRQRSEAGPSGNKRKKERGQPTRPANSDA